jgi:hypothetical protein
MKSKLLWALIVPVAAMFIGCGPVDMQQQDDANLKDISSEIVDQNIDGIDGMNLSEDSKSDYWLNFYIPSAYYYYSGPFSWGSSYPYCFSSLYYPYAYGWGL